MDSQSLGICISITNEFMSRPLNAFFLNPVSNDELPGYSEVISNPMDFSQIESKLSQHLYRNTSEWYKDVCLIYENAVQYHTETSIWGIIATQLLHDFEKMAKGLNFQSREEYFESLSKETIKFGKLISSSPHKYENDSFLQGCIKRSESVTRFPQEKVGYILDKLTEHSDEEIVRISILYIIKSMHKDPPLTYEDDTVTIDFDKLKDQTLNALYLYFQSL